MSDAAVVTERRRTARVFTLALVVYCAGIFAESSMTQPPGLATVERHLSDKVIHGAAFFGMALLAIGTARTRWRTQSLGWQLAFGIVFTSLFGISDEIHQHFTPGRSPDPYDVLADTIGACIAALMVYAALRLRRVAH
jgi:VanZ family protein